MNVRAQPQGCHLAPRTYGSPRIHRALRRQDVFVSRKRVTRIMQAEQIVGRVRRRYRCTTVNELEQPLATNLLARQFEASAPNRRWVGDTTELLTPTGKLYLAAIIDLFSRFLVGWAISAMNNRYLTIKALDMALPRRRPEEGLIHHSDQGSTYASEDYQQVLEKHGITCRVGLSTTRLCRGWRPDMLDKRWGVPPARTSNTTHRRDP